MELEEGLTNPTSGNENGSCWFESRSEKPNQWVQCCIHVLTDLQAVQHGDHPF